MDATRVDTNLIPESYQSDLDAAVTSNSAITASILLMFYMLLGGHIEEETFWAAEKSYAMILSSFLSPRLKLRVSGLLETVISRLSIRVGNVIAGGHGITPLIPLLEFLGAWRERPWHLIITFRYLRGHWKAWIERVTHHPRSSAPKSPMRVAPW